MKASEKAVLVNLMDLLADECCAIALSCGIRRSRMHPDWEAKKVLPKGKFCAFIDENLLRLGLMPLMAELRRLTEQFESDLSNPPGTIIRLDDGGGQP